MKTIGISIVFFLFLSYSGNAQIVRNKAEKQSNRKQIEIDKEQIERDKKELYRFRSDVNMLDAAWQRKDIKEVNEIKDRLVIAMNREIMQSKKKLGMDYRETKESKSEVRSESREVRRSRRDVRTPDNDLGDVRDLRDDRRDRRGDQRDAADDRRDLANQQAVLKRQQEIYNALKVYNFALDGPSIEKALANKKLLSEFIETMETDIYFTTGEQEEDKRELREDRRETRDDRRERRERR